MAAMYREDGGEQENSTDATRPRTAEGQPSAGSGYSRFSDEDLRWAGIAIDPMPDGGESAPDFAACAAASDPVEDHDDPSADLADGLVASFRGEQAAARVAGARRALDDALSVWWRDGLLPDPMVLRDGLLLLNAGYEMDDAHRALLLRAALHYRRGILTAVSHQVDAERTGLILHDAIVDPSQALPLPELVRLVHEDPSCEIWEPYLHAELLATARAYDSDRRHRAELGLAVLDGESWPMQEESIDPVVLFDAVEIDEPSLRWPLIAVILLALSVVAVALFFVRYERTRVAGMIEAPGGVYNLSNGDGTARTVTLDAYLLDSMETTNAQYRRCVRRGACPPPASSSSATKTNYFDEPVFGDYPVIFVDHTAAEQYCSWAGKRLPTVDEWQLAASLAPATQRTYAFPWGDRYVTGAVNDANAAHGDTLAGGEFRPGGNSPLGFSDMAGNVGEWTATLADGTGGEYVVKGGSFVDDADRLRTDAYMTQPSDFAADWLGFRCATTSLPGALLQRFQRTAASPGSE